MNKSPPVQREEHETHSSPYFPRSVEGGMMPFYGSGHSTFAWSIRSHPHVKHVFEHLYQRQTTDFISSLDGIALWRAGHMTDAGWFHVDQNPRHKPHSCSTQSLMNLIDSTSQTGGNAMVAQSHLDFDGYDGQNHKQPHRTCEFYRR